MKQYLGVAKRLRSGVAFGDGIVGNLSRTTLLYLGVVERSRSGVVFEDGIVGDLSRNGVELGDLGFVSTRSSFFPVAPHAYPADEDVVCELNMPFFVCRTACSRFCS